MERGPRIDSLRMVQDVQAHFAFHAVPNESPARVVRHIKDETQELAEALIGGDRQEIGSELADLILLVSRLATMHHIDLSQAVSSKIARNADKYPMHVLREMRESGMGEEEAMAACKRRWDRDRDKSYK